MKKAVILALGFAALLAVSAWAQPMQCRALVDFPFMVGNKTLPAGTYDFIRDDAAQVFRVTDNGKNEAMAQIETRLATLRPGMTDGAYVVFDKIGEKNILSEIWIPGEDGYAITITKGKHEHRIVKAK